MRPRTVAGQNKLKLIAVFLCTVILVLLFQVMNSRSQEAVPFKTGHAEVRQDDSSMFMGVRHASAKEIHNVLPEAKGKPMLLVFSSRLCHDCKRMAPVLDSLKPQFAKVQFKKVDMMDDQKKYPALFRTFKPVSVPVMIFVDASGEIRNVLYNYQPKEEIVTAINQLQTSSNVAASKSKAASKDKH